ncbi:hypothetical protein GWI33_017720 [Rhynchophorus ferrugineus]|uniref:Uncharacterized protein n=1 Tax=Rhynchophorus ferrugineus TaxID=354439 RepID=A0A834M8V8_RHYFE|nr:hypothetical protein GWI33_017720 [Rhynchophorus ferrugineus]
MYFGKKSNLASTRGWEYCFRIGLAPIASPDPFLARATVWRLRGGAGCSPVLDLALERRTPPSRDAIRTATVSPVADPPSTASRTATLSSRSVPASSVLLYFP